MWFGYYFCYLNIYAYFIKCNVFFLCISEYHCELHDPRKGFPLAPERLQIEGNILSNYQRHLLQDEVFCKPPPKLVLNLCHKTNYINHYRNLKSYLELGLRLTNVHRALSFDQYPWLKNYINVKLRKMTLKKISLRWSTRRSLVSLFIITFICSFMFLCIDSFIAGKQWKNCEIDAWWT